MWTYKGKELDETIIDDYIGFVYLITNLSSHKKYVGKKLFKFRRTKKVKGKKKKVTIASDWKTYYGSNNELLDDVKFFGESTFKREILHLCKSKGTANYLEAKEILVRDAIISTNYYNESLRVRIHHSHLKSLI